VIHRREGLLLPLDKYISLHSYVVTIEARHDFEDRSIGHSQHHIEIGMMNSIQIACSNQGLVNKL